MLSRTTGNAADSPGEVPLPRGIVVSVAKSVPDFLISVWFVYLIVMSVRCRIEVEELIQHWRWWIAYEFFAFLGLFLIIMFNVRLLVKNRPELKGRLLREREFQVGFLITAGVIIGLLAKASYDMFGDFSFFRYFLVIYCIRYVNISFATGNAALDHLVEKSLHFFIVVLVTMGPGFLAAKIIAMAFLIVTDTLPEFMTVTDETYRLLIMLCWGAFYYLVMGMVTYVLLRYPRLTLAGLDAASQVPQRNSDNA